MLSLTRKTCGECSFFIRTEKACHLNPPTAFLVNKPPHLVSVGEMPFMTVSSFPTVQENTVACSHYRTNLIEVNNDA
jgi:hypothetical protein